MHLSGPFALKKHVLGMCYVPFAGLRLLRRRGRFLLASKRVRKAKRLHDQAANVNKPGLAFSPAHGARTATGPTTGAREGCIEA